MNGETRKLHLIEELLKVENDETLSKLEAVLKANPPASDSFNLHDFVGILTVEEADEMEKIIEATCEQINPDDWK